MGPVYLVELPTFEIVEVQAWDCQQAVEDVAEHEGQGTYRCQKQGDGWYWQTFKIKF